MLSDRAIFFSDIHVAPDEPEKTATLLAFLDRVRAEGWGRVFILGDLFHFWVGRGHEALPVFREVLARMAALSAAGAEVTILHGNRDFHIGEETARLTGARIVPEETVISLDGRRVRLAHGDLLCRRDTSYQAMRRVIRSAAARRIFLWLPLEARLAVGRLFRRQSQVSVRRKARAAPRAFSFLPSAVRRLFRDGVEAAIVGHVHHARRTTLRAGERTCALYTLGAWDEGNRSYLAFEGGAFRLVDGAEEERELREG